MVLIQLPKLLVISSFRTSQSFSWILLKLLLLELTDLKVYLDHFLVVLSEFGSCQEAHWDQHLTIGYWKYHLLSDLVSPIPDLEFIIVLVVPSQTLLLILYQVVPNALMNHEGLQSTALAWSCCCVFSRVLQAHLRHLQAQLIHFTVGYD